MKRKLKILLLLSVFLLLISNLNPITATADVLSSETVQIPDENLKKVILKKLGKDSSYTITVNDMKGITSLNGENCSINDISGLEYCSSLKSLYLSNNTIHDLSPLTNLTNLAMIELNSNRIYDLSPLSKLNNLRYLYINYNSLSNISPLANLTNLETLEADSNSIYNISSLTNLSKLDTLSLTSNSISDISPLETLSNLDTLYLTSNNISNISPLSNLSKLRTLFLDKNHILDIFPLNNLTNLKKLQLDNQSITLNEETHEGIFTLRDIIKSPSNISDGGIYDSNSNSITWSSLNKDKTVSYSFSKAESIAVASANLTGTVYKPLKCEAIADIEDEDLKDLILITFIKEI